MKLKIIIPSLFCVLVSMFVVDAVFFSYDKSLVDHYHQPKILSVLHEGDNERVIQVQRLTEKQSQNLSVVRRSSYYPLTEKSLYDGYLEIAAVGKISNVREIRTDYVRNGEKDFHYATVFDLTVDRLYYMTDTDETVSPGDTITVCSTHSSYDMDKNLTPMLYDGDEYMMYLKSTSVIKEIGWLYDLTPISDYAVRSPTHYILRKNGDYYEAHHWFDDVYKGYDSKSIKKPEAYGITYKNHIEAGYYWGIERIQSGNLVAGSSKIIYTSEIYQEIYLDYMEENKDEYWQIYKDSPDRKTLLLYMPLIPEDVQEMLFEKALATYSFPDVLEGEYDYIKGLYQDEWRWIRGFYDIPDYTLYEVSAFEKTMQKKIAKYRK